MLICNTGRVFTRFLRVLCEQSGRKFRNDATEQVKAAVNIRISIAKYRESRPDYQIYWFEDFRGNPQYLQTTHIKIGHDYLFIYNFVQLALIFSSHQTL
jgi:hypothetical protein